MQFRSVFMVAIAALAASLLCGAAAAEEAPASSALGETERLDQFGALLDAANETGDFVGLAIAVVRGGETVFLRTYGSIETGGAPIAGDTVFRIASLSKGFASTLAGIAVADGLLSLDVPITR